MLQNHTRFKQSAIASVLAASATVPAFAANSGAPFVVASSPNASNFVLAVARSKAGDFAVEYSDSNGHIFVRVYNADGTPKDSGFQVGPDTGGSSTAVAIDPSGTGNIIVAWNQATTASPNGETLVQRYSENGTALGTAIDVGAAPFPGRSSTNPMLAMDDDGDFAVAWTTVTDKTFIPIPHTYSSVVASEASKTYAAVYKADGSVIKPATAIDNVLTKYFSPAIYSIKNPDYYNCDILRGIAFDGHKNLTALYLVGRRASLQTGVGKYTYKLSKQGGLSLLSDVATSAVEHSGGVRLQYPTTTDFGVDASGNYAVEWVDYYVADPFRIHVSRYAADGTFQGEITPIQIPTNYYNNSFHPYQNPTLSMAPSGDFVVTWGVRTQIDLFGDGYLYDSFDKDGQYFHADGTANGNAFVIASDPSFLTFTDMATAVDGGGNLVSVWAAIDSSQTAYLFGNLTPAP
jgi:hypothetical protein